jgi:hypothetical protein
MSGDDAPFVLHVAFAAEHATTASAAGSSPALRPKGVPLGSATPPVVPALPAPAIALYSPPTHTAAVSTSSGRDLSSSPIRSAGDPATPQQSPNPHFPTAVSHQLPFGFLSFPLKASAASVSASAATPVPAAARTTPAFSVASTHPGQVTLKHVRELLPTLFPPSHVAQLVTAGVLSHIAARALQSGSYFFMAAGGGVNAPSSAVGPHELSIAIPFLPVSPVQEEFVLARHCRPVLVLKPSSSGSLLTKQASSYMPHGTPNKQSSPATAAMLSVAGGSGYVQDYLPPAASQGGRRSSFDLSSQSTAMMRELQHQDSLSLLASSGGVGGTSLHHYSSPPPIQRAVSARTPLMAAPSSDEKQRVDHDSGDALPSQFEAATMASPKGARAMAGTGGTTGNDVPYHSLADGWPVQHFDDVIREKSTAEVRGPLQRGGRAAHISITVTGELLDKPVRNVARSRTQHRTPTRRHASTMGAADLADDDRDGSVKQFSNIHDFLVDEERRRAKYDAAAAAYAALAQEEEPSSSGSPMSGTSRSASSSGLQQREPLAQTPLWISIEDGDDAATEHIGSYFGLHPLTVEDCQSRGIREKLEVFPEYLFLGQLGSSWHARWYWLLFVTAHVSAISFVLVSQCSMPLMTMAATVLAPALP